MAYNVKFLKGTAGQFNAEGFVKDLNTFYYIDNADLYLGNIKLSNANDLATAIAQIEANDKDIENIQKELAALTGNDSGSSINQMITDAIAAARVEITAEIDADVKAEADRAKGIEGGLETRLAAVEADYLKEEHKTALEGLISAEATTARAAEKANADAIAILNGDATVEGSVAKEVKDAINEFATATTDNGTYDTFAELVNYISTHGGEAAEMGAAIEALETKVGEKSVKTQIEEAIAAENLDQYATDEELQQLTNVVSEKAAQSDLEALTTEVGKKALATELDAAEEKITALEGKLEGVTKVTESIATAKQEAITAASGDATTKADAALASAKTYTNEEIAKLADVYDVKGAANTALTDAKAYTDTEIGKLSYDAAGSAAQALVDAKAYADGLATNYDAAGSAAAAETNAKAYADSLAGNYDAKGSAATAKAEAIEAAATDATTKANTAESNAKAYVDTALTWGTIA